VQDLPSFVVFADDWGEHPSSCQHLFRRVAQRHRTVWVNTLGLRAPRLSVDDLRRGARKVRRWFETSRDTAEAANDSNANASPSHVHVIAPPMLPWSRPSALRAVQRIALRHALAAAKEKFALDRPVIVTTLPNAVDALGVIGERRVVYYCVDDFTLWPGVDAIAARTMEEELLARADVVITTSEALRRSRTRGSNVPHSLPHGVDVDHLATASDPATDPWPGIRNGRPVLGYLGLIDERTDASLVAQIARSRPDWDIALVGPVDRVPDLLRRVSNIRLVPAVRYEQVPRVLAAFDVAILPYARNELTRAINPLKLREYLASGRPVVATPLPEVAAYSDVVHLASNAETFVAACAFAIDGPRDLRAERLPRLRNESWDARAEAFLSMCLSANDRNTPVPTETHATGDEVTP
jgi:glycosyltransferase involved in cell wall biosynthesis